MDPDRTLEEMRRAVRAWEHSPPATEQEYQSAERAASAASALDDWISGGGFLPRAWAREVPEIERSGD